MSRRVDFALGGNMHSCDFCGCHDWSAEWRGQRGIHVCHGCASKYLPLLLADATYHAGWTMQDGVSDLEKFENKFWRSQAANMHCTSARGPQWKS